MALQRILQRAFSKVMNGANTTSASDSGPPQSTDIGANVLDCFFRAYCCKGPKLPGDKFPATRRSQRRPPICVASITLPRLPVSLSSGDEAPHIFTRKSRLQPGEFWITSAQRLLQQYLPLADSCSAAKRAYSITSVARASSVGSTVKPSGNPGGLRCAKPR
jgi:hypothetical protein